MRPRSPASPTRGAGAPDVAAIAPEDVEDAVAALRSAGFGGQVGRLLGYPVTSPSGVVLATAERTRGRPAGVVCCASFTTTGWIGALGVVPEARGNGIGTALTQAAIGWLRERGAQTILLYATDAGRPIYERLGFVAEGHAVAWQGLAPRSATHAGGVRLRALRRRDAEAIAAVDRVTTGEQRDAVLGALRPPRGMAACAQDGELIGFAAGSPWGASVAVAAADPEAGVALMASVCSGPRAGTLIVPEANRPAADAVRRWDLIRANSAERMRLGPPVAWAPERQFGLFNLFWG